MNRIRKLRKARGWSVVELADRLGVDEQTLYRWEIGFQEPRRIAKKMVAHVFGVSEGRVFPNGRRPRSSHRNGKAAGRKVRK